jgi:hypothetical protein
MNNNILTQDQETAIDKILEKVDFDTLEELELDLSEPKQIKAPTGQGRGQRAEGRNWKEILTPTNPLPVS